MYQVKLLISFTKSFLLFSTSIIICACSFHPLYRVNSDDDYLFTIHPHVNVSTLNSHHGMILKNHLIDVFKPNSHSNYSLMIELNETVADLGIRKDDTSGRKQTTISARIMLSDKKLNKVVYTCNLNSINAFTLQESKYYAAQKAEDFAMQQSLQDLANKIFLHVNIYFSTLQ